MADATMENDKQKFVTIDLSKKQIDMAHPTVNGKNGKTYVRVFAPGGGVFFYPAESIKTKNFVSLSIPFNGIWKSFVLPQNRFKESTRQEGMSYFSFPRKQKDNPDKDYLVRLKKSERLPDGTYEEYTSEISSTLLKEHVDVAVSKKEIQDLFVGTMISEKLIHPFVSPKGVIS